MIVNESYNDFGNAYKVVAHIYERNGQPQVEPLAFYETYFSKQFTLNEMLVIVSIKCGDIYGDDIDIRRFDIIECDH